MDQILDSPVAEERRLNYAGFWIRVAAYLIDGIIIAIVNAILTSLIFTGSSSNLFLTALVPMILNILYFPVLESSERQASVGKMAVGIRVGDIHGERISFGNALGRYFGKILSALILCIGFMMAGWDDKKQALHDKLADTYVYYA